MKLSDLIETYTRPDLRHSTVAGHLVTLRKLAHSVGGRTALTSLKAANIHKFVDSLHANGNTKATIAKHVRYAHAVMEWCKVRGHLTDNPVNGVKVQQSFRPKDWPYITHEQVDQVVSAAPFELARATVLCRYAGCRFNEAVRMRYDQVDFARRVITITPTPDDAGRLEEGTKGRLRTVPLDPRVDSVIGRGDNNERICGNLIHSKSQRWHEFPKFVTWEGAPFHSLRKSCGMDWADKVPISTVAEWMGHSVEVAVSHYLRPHDEHFSRISGLST